MPATNMLGIDVAGMDVPLFLASARLLFPVFALAWLAALLFVKRPGFLLVGILGANAYAWAVTNYPLQRLYGLGPSHDRVNNVGLCQVVAAGNSPLETVQVGQMHFEPFWSFFVTVLSGWDPDRLLRIYPFLSLVMVVGFALSLEFGLRGSRDGSGWSPWERVLAAGFATLLASAPLDFTGSYRVPWALTFLLKPNHALGFVLFPLILRAFVSIRGWWGRLGVGMLLHLLGWVFVLHMIYVTAGLLLFAAASLWSRRKESARDLVDVVAVVGINLAAVSPYLYMLLVGYPFLDPSTRMMVPPGSAHLLEPTLRMGWMFSLGIWGVVQVHRRGDRLGRLWLAQLAAAALLWLSYLVLSALHVARERDELCFWLRFLFAIFAAVGAWDLVGRAARWIGKGAWSPVSRAAAIGAVVVPWLLPSWWDPLAMDAYFPTSLTAVEEARRIPNDFLRLETPRHAVIVTDPEYARYVAALGARRVLRSSGLHATKDHADRLRLEHALLRPEQEAGVHAAAARYGVQYLIVTPALLRLYPGSSLAAIEKRADLRGVLFWGDRQGEFVAVFRLAESSS